MAWHRHFQFSSALYACNVSTLATRCRCRRSKRLKPVIRTLAASSGQVHGPYIRFPYAADRSISPPLSKCNINLFRGTAQTSPSNGAGTSFVIHLQCKCQGIAAGYRSLVWCMSLNCFVILGYGYRAYSSSKRRPRER
jgi:hypothetical protein